MAVMLMAERESFTLLGWHVRELMNRKRIVNQEELAQKISAAGYPISQPAVSKILRGKTEPNRRFIAALAVALDLDAAERRELADIFSYGEAATSEAITPENMRGMEEIKERVRRENSRANGNEEGRESEIEDRRA